MSTASSPTRRLDEPLKKLLGTRTANVLAKMGLHTAGDLLTHYPRRYAEANQLTKLGDLKPGAEVSVIAQVLRTELGPTRAGLFRFQAIVQDDDGDFLGLAFFGRSLSLLKYHEKRLQVGQRAVFSGTIKEYRGQRQLTHPEYHLIGVDAGFDDPEAVEYRLGLPIPIYRATAKLPTWKVQHCVQVVLRGLAEDDVPDPLPDQIRNAHGFPTKLAALRLVHEPQTLAEAKLGQKRLRYEEAFVLQAALAIRRVTAAQSPATARPPKSDGLAARFDANLPFELTQGQKEVGEQLTRDLSQASPMQRLLQGEVGSGKTVVALRAMLQVIDAGGQAALLAPTEVLAAQHAVTLRNLLGPLAPGRFDLFTDPSAADSPHQTKVALLTGSQSTADRKEALLQAASGEAGIVVGTHALLSDNVQFADLGLIVVDEQHRFGVEQRDALRNKGRVVPHLLVMTATPIPRTVAITAFGDLEVSTLAEIPVGRQGVTTHVLAPSNERWMTRAWERIAEEVGAGHRAYVVCPRIVPQEVVDERSEDHIDAPNDGYWLENSDTGPSRPLNSVIEVAEQLRNNPVLSGIGIGVMHGQLTGAEKEAAMASFASGATSILVATTVIEVGVDVPEATVMVIYDADRFGLSQLHQLRGRVGRGSAPGLCLLISGAEKGSVGEARVNVLVETSDGFELAQRDLELRAEGDVLGSAQSGRTTGLRLLRVVRDADLIADARVEATAVVDADPSLRKFPALADAITRTLDDSQAEFLDRA